MYAVTKQVKMNDKISVYERWLDHEPNESKTLPK
jgi:hypothetical protein